MMTAIARPLAVLVALAAVGQSAARAAETASAPPLLVNGQVAAACRLSPASEGAGGANITFSQNGGNASSLTVNTMVDATTAKTQAAVGVVQFQVLCTGAHTLTVNTASGGLVNTTTQNTAAGFANRIDYGLQAAWNGVTRNLTTSGSAASLDLSGADANTGALTVTVTVPSGEGPLIAGAYQDTISIDLSAN